MKEPLQNITQIPSFHASSLLGEQIFVKYRFHTVTVDSSFLSFTQFNNPDLKSKNTRGVLKMKKILIAAMAIASEALSIETYAIGFGGLGRTAGGSVSRSVSHSAPHSVPGSGVHPSGAASKAEGHATNGSEAGKTESNSITLPAPRYNPQSCSEEERRTGRNGCR